jgi:hypothetical protein
MAENTSITNQNDFQHLLSQGFTDKEAARLIHMKDNVANHIEYRELLAESRRLSFVRWLIDHNRLSQ